MSNDIDELFARIDADPTQPHPGDIEALVTYYRELRSKKGSKAKKDPGPKVEIDLSKLGLKPAAEAPLKRRF